MSGRKLGYINTGITGYEREDFRESDNNPEAMSFITPAIEEVNQSSRRRQAHPVEAVIPDGVNPFSFIFMCARALGATYGSSFSVVDVEKSNIETSESDEPDRDAVVAHTYQASRDLEHLKAKGQLGFAFVLEPQHPEAGQEILNSHIQAKLASLSVPTLILRCPTDQVT